MKKLAWMLILVMLISLATSCQPSSTPAEEDPAPVETPDEGDEEEPVAEETNALGDSEAMVYSSLYSGEISSMNYLIEGATNEQTVGANVIDTLVEYNQYGELIPGLAESWEVSDDGLTWTFHLREGAKWFNHLGEPVADVTAHDFVSAAKYVCDPQNQSGTDYMILDLIQGASDYYSTVSEYYGTLGDTDEKVAEESGADFSTVGIKAVDDYTLEYTTVDNYPFFPTCLTYVCYMPAYGPLLDELKLDFGTANDRMYYNGAYIVTEYEPQVRRVYEKNFANWDADNVHITKIELIYNAEALTLAPTMVLRGEIDYAAISNDIVDEWLTNNPEYVSKGRAVPDYSYFYGFNFRAASGDAERLETWEQNNWEPENWNKAVQNTNFRRAVMAAFDRNYSMYALEPDEQARIDVTQRTITPRTFTNVDGTDYSMLPEFDNVDQYFFNPEEALKYKEAAMEELQAAGVSLPVKMVLSYRSDMANWEQECVLIKQQLEEVLGTDFLVCELYGGPADGFLRQVRRNGMYGFMRLNWGADYEDPSTWAQPFAIDDTVRDTDNLREANSYNDMDYLLFEDGDSEMKDLLTAYYAKVDEAKTIADTLPRYTAFAEAEAMLIENAVFIPYYIDPAAYQATRLNIFESQYAPCGVSNLRYKGQKVYDDYVDMETYTERFEEWLDKMGVQ